MKRRLEGAGAEMRLLSLRTRLRRVPRPPVGTLRLRRVDFRGLMIATLIALIIAMAVGVMGVEHDLFDNPDDDASPRSTIAPRVFATSYQSCAEARAAGRAPVLRDEAGYGLHLDADQDGIACEPHLPMLRP